MSNQLTRSSLRDVANTSGKDLAQMFLNVAALVMVDTSSSMEASDCPGNHRRFDVACEQLISLQREEPGKLGVIAWNDSAKFCPGGIPTSPDGGTDMVKVLEFVKPADGCGIRLILISDGEPNDPAGTLSLARQFKSKIDTIFCGPENGSGRDFLRQLAAATGGQFVEQNVNNLGRLAETVSKLLPGRI